MKKFISMVMAAAMVVSLVPATAFAKDGDVVVDKAIVFGALEEGKDFGYTKLNSGVPADKVVGFVNRENAPEIQLTIDEVYNNVTQPQEIKKEIVVELDGAVFTTNNGINNNMSNLAQGALASFSYDGKVATTSFAWDAAKKVGTATTTDGLIVKVEFNKDLDKATYTVIDEAADPAILAADKKIVIDLTSKMDDTDVNDVAYVTVDTDIVGGDIEKTAYISVIGETLDIDVDDVVEFEVDGEKMLETITIESKVTPFAGETLTIKLSKGFEFKESTVAGYAIDGKVDGDTFKMYASSNPVTLTGVVIYAEDAAADAEATITVSAKDFAKDSVVVAKVLADAVTMTVDEEEDVPVIWNGVNVLNTGLDTDCDHKALTVTIKESVAKAWADNKGFTLDLPEGVYVADAKLRKVAGTTTDALTTADFATAYAKGEFEYFKFARGIFAESTAPVEYELDLTLVADPDFVGDVTLTLEGAALDTQEVVIAKFVSPVVIEAAQNDVIIDYRNTEIPTSIVVKEAEAGLFALNTEIGFGIEKLSAVSDYSVFEDDATFTVNEESEMEIKEVGNLGFKVTEQSNEEAAVVTISDIELYMARDVAAGAYDLVIDSATTTTGYAVQPLFGENCASFTVNYNTDTVADWTTAYNAHKAVGHSAEGDAFVGNVADYSNVAKEAFVNVITAGRDKDDASFTKKVIVPIGENYMIAGEETVALEVPAYINADNYTMLPVRAVATALGINNNNVIWSQAAKQVTILYGQRIITMTVGESVVYVNASAIPASAAVEIVDGRAFLGFRDLANALGVTTIDYVDGKAIMN